MKQRALIKKLRSVAKEQGREFAFQRRGGKHDIYRLGDQIIVVPRHRELNERTAQKILDQATGDSA